MKFGFDLSHDNIFPWKTKCLFSYTRQMTKKYQFMFDVWLSNSDIFVFDIITKDYTDSGPIFYFTLLGLNFEFGFINSIPWEIEEDS